MWWLCMVAISAKAWSICYNYPSAEANGNTLKSLLKIRSIPKLRIN